MQTFPVIVIVEDDQSVVATHEFEDETKAQDYLDSLRVGVPSDLIEITGKTLVTVNLQPKQQRFSVRANPDGSPTWSVFRSDGYQMTAWREQEYAEKLAERMNRD